MGRRGTPARLMLLALAAAGCAHAPPRDGTWHRVARGETLGAIASRHGVTVAALVSANALPNPDLIREGELLLVPRASAVRSPAPSSQPPGPLLAWPVVAPISSRFGARDGKPHEGIDLLCADGTEVRAAADGRVVYAGDKLRGYGHLLIVAHEGGLTTIYAHNSRLLAAEGARVARGEVISLSGHSGRASAPHLHFEVREGDVPRDPEHYLTPIERSRLP